MKKYSSYLLVGLCSMALTLPVGKYANASAATNKVEVAGQPVDLTYAAEKALPAVVYIKYVQNSKTKTVEVQSDPFSDFFSDPFGFFGNPESEATEA
jgi:serine protease Do